MSDSLLIIMNIISGPEISVSKTSSLNSLIFSITSRAKYPAPNNHFDFTKVFFFEKFTENKFNSLKQSQLNALSSQWHHEKVETKELNSNIQFTFKLDYLNWNHFSLSFHYKPPHVRPQFDFYLALTAQLLWLWEYKMRRTGFVMLYGWKKKLYVAYII